MPSERISGVRRSHGPDSGAGLIFRRSRRGAAVVVEQSLPPVSESTVALRRICHFREIHEYIALQHPDERRQRAVAECRRGADRWVLADSLKHLGNVLARLRSEAGFGSVLRCDLMQFGIFYEHQLPKPWSDDDEYRLLGEALDQVVLADRLGVD